MLSAMASLQLGPFCVVLETFCSGISELPLPTFILMMQPIHLAIGIVEGAVTLAVVSFVQTARPELLREALEERPLCSGPLRGTLLAFFAAALLTGGMVSVFASDKPDGLEWAITQVTGREELGGTNNARSAALAALQEKTAFLPDYSFRKSAEAGGPESMPTDPRIKEQAGTAGTSVSGIVGALATLIFAFGVGFVLRKRNLHAGNTFR
jgi:cobalt/nickel transport system permease protein